MYTERLRAGLLTGLLVTGSAVAAVDYDFIIGGGWQPTDSQVQIEHNVERIGRLLDGVAGERRRQVYFTDGHAPGADVKLNLAPDQWPTGADEILSRIYGGIAYQPSRLRENRLGKLDGPTTPGSLVPALREAFARPAPGDRVFIYYNGHGLPDPEQNAHPLKFIQPARNYLRLWNDSRLDVRELEALLTEIDPAVPVRFVFTQCYSGGFAHLIHPDANPDRGLAEHQRCGFLAVSPWTESEGCTASIESDDYRDYTRYLLEALDRRAERADWDGNGTVGLFEAHLHTLRTADSRDLPRATSEYYLENWQPWYRRWLGGDQADNLYSRLALEIAQREGVLRDGRVDLETLNSRRAELDQQRAALRSAVKAGKRTIAQLQARVRGSLAVSPADLPDAAHARTALASRAEALPDYRALVETQGRLGEQDEQLLAVEREAAQLDKVMRLRRLGRALADLYAYGPPEAVADYERLRACEAAPL